MNSPNIFKRTEIKYIISKKQQEKLLNVMNEYMDMDEFGENIINSIYFDTPTSSLIRKSMQKPTYKEKLRVRSYGVATHDTKVYIELKKKFKSVVYKRRVALKEKEAMDYLEKGILPKKQNQILKEIDYFCKVNEGIMSKMYISCEREAYFSKLDKNFRITFDKNIIYRQDNLSLCEKPYGNKILKEDMILMEVKCLGGMPLWFSKLLTDNKIYKTKFSKYANAYKMTKVS